MFFRWTTHSYHIILSHYNATPHHHASPNHIVLIMTSVLAATSQVTCPNGERYDDITVYLFHALQKRLLKFYQGDPADETKFTRILSQAYLRLTDQHPLGAPVRELLAVLPGEEAEGRETTRLKGFSNDLRTHTIDHSTPSHSPNKRAVFRSADGLKRSLPAAPLPSMGLYFSLRSRVDYVHSIK